jgi:hypothetical protein
MWLIRDFLVLVSILIHNTTIDDWDISLERYQNDDTEYTFRNKTRRVEPR